MVFSWIRPQTFWLQFYRRRRFSSLNLNFSSLNVFRFVTVLLVGTGSRQRHISESHASLGRGMIRGETTGVEPSGRNFPGGIFRGGIFRSPKIILFCFSFLFSSIHMNYRLPIHVCMLNHIHRLMFRKKNIYSNPYRKTIQPYRKYILSHTGIHLEHKNI